MKKLLLASFLVIMGLTNAQEKNEGLKGTWFASAQVGYQSTNDGSESGKSTSTTILPIVGYFVAPSTAVGVAVGNVGVKSTNQFAEDVTLKTNLLVVEPLARKYWNIHGGLFFFGQLAVPIISGKTKVTAAGQAVPDSDIKVNQFGLALSGGFDYVLTKHFTVEFSYNLANLSFTTIKNYPGTVKDIKTTDFSLAHIATVAPDYNKAIFGPNGNAISTLSFGFKFLF
ncbi:outer membrane beta-barrel protein [Chryseobacterium oryctis]|uniref:Outer membrane beta-barrel protein n=1 Tax=Chryseobacterium oryctis TaxID=2952618 RepID=A0ABT3HPP1_9FLAO|nr:outer membrane beta-barrel protein [Chryseobacterium oryctis]MCW3161719.1 outer membrane beta-barrel protein [Chryseobacterium oryctis]